MYERRRYNFILSVYLTTRGMAWVLFEGQYAPFDWGVIVSKGVLKSRRSKQKCIALMEQYQPDVLVLEDTSEHGSKRADRIQQLNAAIHTDATERGVPVAQFSRSDIQRAFAYLGATNKDIIAGELAKHMPIFRRYLPPVRKPWMSEHPRMGLFDATALALLFYQHQLVS